jgi:uncharacterized protein YcbX
LKGVVQELYRFPLKGFTPERVAHVSLSVADQFPDDRIYAVENGPSGFLEQDPSHVSKTKLAVLVGIPRVALVQTKLDLKTHALAATAPGMSPFRGKLNVPQDRERFAIWLANFLGEQVGGTLKVLRAPGHRFLDSPLGYVSVVNLASVRDLERRMGRPIDPLRFRSNFYVDGWAPWSELKIPNGSLCNMGKAQLKVFYPTKRCLATHVNPLTGTRDLDIIGALSAITPNVNCGFYVHVVQDGIVQRGDSIETV